MINDRANARQQGASGLDQAQAKLLMHPARFRILQALVGQNLSTRALDERLPDVPLSSLYRHLRVLMEAGFVDIVETRPARGVAEKVYGLALAPRLRPAEADALSASEHLQLFTTFLLTLYRDFARYLARAEREELAFGSEMMGYTEVPLYATPEEMRRVSGALNQALLPLARRGPGGGRQRYRLATVLFPERATGDGEESGES